MHIIKKETKQRKIKENKNSSSFATPLFYPPPNPPKGGEGPKREMKKIYFKKYIFSNFPQGTCFFFLTLLKKEEETKESKKNSKNKNKLRTKKEKKIAK